MANIINRENPKARLENLLIEEVAGELLVFDVGSNQAHCLNETAAAIWRHCDGNRSLESLAEHLFPELATTDARRLVSLGIERLNRRHLMDVSVPAVPSVDLTKRQLLRKVAILATAAGVVAPLVTSVIAPTSAHAFSCLPSNMPCTTPFQCCSGLCVSMLCS